MAEILPTLRAYCPPPSLPPLKVGLNNIKEGGGLLTPHTHSLARLLRAKKLAAASAEDPGQQYRDRAKERRKKFGAEDVPPPNR